MLRVPGTRATPFSAHPRRDLRLAERFDRRDEAIPLAGKRLDEALSEVTLRDTDGSNEHAGCSVIISGSSWVLRAFLNDPSDDADVYCRAYCFSLN
jgi:hypothetical protein